MTVIASAAPDATAHTYSSAGAVDDDRPPDSTPLRHRFVAGALTLAIILALGSLVVTSIDTRPTATELSRVMIVVLFAIAGVMLERHHSNGQLAPILMAGCLLGGVALVADAFAVHRGSTSIFVDAIVRVVGSLVVGVVFHFLVGLPNGRLMTRGRRAMVLLGYSVAAATGFVMLGTRDHVRSTPLLLLVGCALAVGIPLGNLRYRAASAIDRHRMQWIGCALTVTAALVVVLLALNLIVDWPSQVFTVTLAASGLIPLALMAGTHQPFDTRVDNLLAHTVSFAGLTVVVVTMYIIVILGFGRVPTADQRSLVVLSMVAAAAAAIMYVPARNRLADVANHLVYGERTAPDQTLRTFGQRMTRAIPLEELLLQLAESLRKTMLLKSAEVWTGSNGRFEFAAGVPHRGARPIIIGEKELPVVARAGISGGTWIEIWLGDLVAERQALCLRVAPLAHAGELLGFIVLERYADGQEFAEADDLAVTEVARQVSLALHNVQLDSALQASLDQLRDANEKLRSSRARIVAAGDAERRRLERNLHDGAQQYLVAMSVKLRLAHDAVEDGSPDVLDLLDELKNDMRDAVAELRALAHGIFPPLLVSGGLADALPSAATRASIPTVVEVKTRARYDTEIEAAVYFCVLEALQNASKHAGDQAEATVRVWEEADELRFSVHDNGAGFTLTDAPEGHGFVNMADRLGAYGGTLEVDTAPGRGVRIMGSIPLRSDQQAG